MVSLTPDEFLGIDVNQRYKGKYGTVVRCSRCSRYRSYTFTNTFIFDLFCQWYIQRQGNEIRDLPSLLAAAESHHHHLAALEFTSLAFLPCAPTPIADPYTVTTNKGLDKDKGYSQKDKGYSENDHSRTDKAADKDQVKGKGVDKGVDNDKDQESLLSRILHNGVLGAFSSFTIDPPTTPTSPVTTVPSVPRAPLTLNNKGDEENSPV